MIKMNSIQIVILFLLIIIVTLSCQNFRSEIIPPERRIAWNVGIPEGIPHFPVGINVKDAPYNAVGDGIADDSQFLQDAINNCAEGYAVYLPEGIYKIQGEVNLKKGVVLRGDGPEKSKIKLYGSKTTIRLGDGNYSFRDEKSIISGNEKGSATITVDNTSGYSEGDYVMIDQLDYVESGTHTGADDQTHQLVDNTANWNDNQWTGYWVWNTTNRKEKRVGQKLKQRKTGYALITSNSSNTLYFKEGLSYSDFDKGDEYKIKDFITKIGSEGPCRYCGRENGDRSCGQINKIKAVNGNTLILETPLYLTFEHEPKIVRIREITGHEYEGIEDLYIENADGEVPANVFIDAGAFCWIKNIESYNAKEQHIHSRNNYQCEIRDSYFHHQQRYRSVSYGICIRRQTTGMLIENNIFYHLRSPVMLAGCSGNVIGYNYFYYGVHSATGWVPFSISFHAVHNFMNLFEGNIANGVFADWIHGSASHNTFFRNYMKMDLDRPETHNTSVYAVKLDFYNKYFNFTGNVLGYENATSTYEIEGINCDRSNPAIYKLGYDGQGDCDPEHNDSQVKGTLYRHGNFNYATNSVIWDQDNSNHDLPSSLYLTSKPAFFINQPWPSIGPDMNPLVGFLPAKNRFKEITGIVNIY